MARSGGRDKRNVGVPPIILRLHIGFLRPQALGCVGYQFEEMGETLTSTSPQFSRI